MAVDAEGYGAKDQGLDRLIADARVLSPAGIERVAWGWDRHEDPRLMERFYEAERAALRVIEKNNRGAAWDEARKRMLDLTEGRASLEDWKAEHGDVGHKGERALLAAALAIVARDKLDHEHYVTLVRPMSEALPWLLPEVPPEARR
jgi:hypothetical protein